MQALFYGYDEKALLNNSLTSMSATLDLSSLYSVTKASVTKALFPALLSCSC